MATSTLASVAIYEKKIGIYFSQMTRVFIEVWIQHTIFIWKTENTAMTRDNCVKLDVAFSDRLAIMFDLKRVKY